MTAVRLTDVITPSLWTPAFVLADPVLTAFFHSGIAAMDPNMQQFASSESGTVNIRWLKPMDGTQPENQSNDDPTSHSAPLGTGTGVQTAAKLFRNQSWASMDLTAALFSPDPVAAIRTQVAGYWAHRYQAYIISVCNGITLSNVANNSGDMVFDATDTAKPLMSLDNILQAKQTMGDTAGALTVIAMHSVVLTNLQRQQLISYLRDADANINVPYYGGYRVVVDDGLPVVAGGGVTGVTITAGGSAYATPPAVTFSAPGGSGTTAVGTAVLTGGVVTSVTITNAGSGYSAAPTVTFTGGGFTTAATATAAYNTAGFIYTSYLYAAGFIRWGTGTPKMPVAIFRDESAGDGEGMETFWNRQHWVGHPTGFNYTLLNGGAPQFNPTNTQVATAASWNRVWARKQTPFVAIKTTG